MDLAPSPVVSLLWRCTLLYRHPSGTRQLLLRGNYRLDWAFHSAPELIYEILCQNDISATRIQCVFCLADHCTYCIHWNLYWRSDRSLSLSAQFVVDDSLHYLPSNRQIGRATPTLGFPNGQIIFHLLGTLQMGKGQSWSSLLASSVRDAI